MTLKILDMGWHMFAPTKIEVGAKKMIVPASQQRYGSHGEGDKLSSSGHAHSMNMTNQLRDTDINC